MRIMSASDSPQFWTSNRGAMKIVARKFPFAAALAALLASVLPLSQSLAVPKNTAVLQGLDKVTARVSTFEAPLDEPVRFGAFSIRVRHCDRTPPEEEPEATAFIEIDADREGEEPAAIFTGWMFASTPALNAVEHPVYDVWLLDCVDRDPAAAKDATEGAESDSGGGSGGGSGTGQ